MGSREGALKTRKIMLDRDPDYYKKLSRLGGAAPKARTFDDPKMARDAGIKSGEARRKRKLDSKND